MAVRTMPDVLKNRRSHVRREELETVKKMHSEGSTIEVIADALKTFPKTIKKIIDGTYNHKFGGGWNKGVKGSTKKTINFDSIEDKFLEAAKTLLAQVEAEDKELQDQQNSIQIKRNALRDSPQYKKANIIITLYERLKIGLN